MNETVLFDVDGQGVATLCVNRPEARNALNWQAQERFAALVTAVAQDPTIRVLIITGSGARAFIAGGDLKELRQHPTKADAARLNRTMGQALTRLTTLAQPVIAAINGDALGGGCEIVTACDLRIARATARFAFAQVQVGLTTGWGGTARLVRLVGQSAALELLLTARRFDAHEAQALGLVHRIVASEVDVVAAARAWARDLVALPRQALAAMKALVYAAAHQPLVRTQKLEAQLFLDLWATPDHLEALAAFGEKRPAIFNQDWRAAQVDESDV